MLLLFYSVEISEWNSYFLNNCTGPLTFLFELILLKTESSAPAEDPPLGWLHTSMLGLSIPKLLNFWERITVPCGFHLLRIYRTNDNWGTSLQQKKRMYETILYLNKLILGRTVPRNPAHIKMWMLLFIPTCSSVWGEKSSENFPSACHLAQ